jgi:8-oxo-dGTP diphosphatase
LTSKGKEMNQEHPGKPIVAVGVFVLCGNEVLLIKRAKEPAKGLYSVPGGSQDLGETSQEAAIREVLEETGLSISSLRLFEVFDSIHRDVSGAIQYHYVIVDYIASIQPQQKSLAKASSDAEEAIWVTLAQARQMPLTRGLLPMLENIFSVVGSQ